MSSKVTWLGHAALLIETEGFQDFNRPILSRQPEHRPGC